MSVVVILLKRCESVYFIFLGMKWSCLCVCMRVGCHWKSFNCDSKLQVAVEWLSVTSHSHTYTMYPVTTEAPAVITHAASSITSSFPKEAAIKQWLRWFFCLQNVTVRQITSFSLASWTSHMICQDRHICALHMHMHALLQYCTMIQ